MGHGVTVAQSGACCEFSVQGSRFRGIPADHSTERCSTLGVGTTAEGADANWSHEKTEGEKAGPRGTGVMGTGTRRGRRAGTVRGRVANYHPGSQVRAGIRARAVRRPLHLVASFGF